MKPSFWISADNFNRHSILHNSSSCKCSAAMKCVFEGQFQCSAFDPVSSHAIGPQTKLGNDDVSLDLQFYPGTNDPKYKVVADSMICIIYPKYKDVLASSKPDFSVKLENFDGEIPKSVNYTYIGEMVIYNKFTVL